MDFTPEHHTHSGRLPTPWPLWPAGSCKGQGRRSPSPRSRTSATWQCQHADCRNGCSSCSCTGLVQLQCCCKSSRGRVPDHVTASAQVVNHEQVLGGVYRAACNKLQCCKEVEVRACTNFRKPWRASGCDCPSLSNPEKLDKRGFQVHHLPEAALEGIQPNLKMDKVLSLHHLPECLKESD